MNDVRSESVYSFIKCCEIALAAIRLRAGYSEDTWLFGALQEAENGHWESASFNAERHFWD